MSLSNKKKREGEGERQPEQEENGGKKSTIAPVHS